MADTKRSSLRGIQALAEALRAEDFPMDFHQIDYAVGDLDIEDGQGGYIPVRDVTDSLNGKMFRSAEEAVRAIRDAAAHAPRSGRVA